MLSKALKKNWNENKNTYISAAVLIGVGMAVGMKHQRQIDVNNLVKSIRKGRVLIPNMGDQVLPELALKTIPEIKTFAAALKNTTVKDAIVVTVDGLPMLFVR